MTARDRSTNPNPSQGALDRLMGSRSVVVIAHRLSTVQHADAILVIKGGAIAEKGTHAELLAIEGGIYKGLVSRQLQYA